MVGAGVAGLVAARYLCQRGCDVTLIERASAMRADGAGLMLGINAMKILGELGLAEAVVEQGQVLRAMGIVNARGGSLGKVDGFYMEKETGYKTIAIHRKKFHEILSAGIPEERIFTGVYATKFEHVRDGVCVTLSNSKECFFDLVVAADGIHSSTRVCLGVASQLRYSGYTCWRFVIECPQIGETDEASEYWGKGRRFGVVPLGDGRLYCFATLNAQKNRWCRQRIKLDAFKALYADFSGSVPVIMASLKESDVLIQDDLFDQMQICLRQGRVVFAGDAAHAVTPNMGQGAAMALEDICVLDQVLGGYPSIDYALDAYEKRRRPRVKRIRDRSYRIGKIAQWESSSGRALRDSLLQWAPGRGLSKDLCRRLLDY